MKNFITVNMNEHLKKYLENKKRKHFDLFFEAIIGKIRVEVNTINSSYIKPRNMPYLCDIYLHHTLIGQEYDQDTSIIQINLNYEQTDEEYIRKYQLRDRKKKA